MQCRVNRLALVDSLVLARGAKVFQPGSEDGLLLAASTLCELTRPDATMPTPSHCP
jgi:hypothetical protein